MQISMAVFICTKFCFVVTYQSSSFAQSRYRRKQRPTGPFPVLSAFRTSSLNFFLMEINIKKLLYPKVLRSSGPFFSFHMEASWGTAKLTLLQPPYRWMFHIICVPAIEYRWIGTLNINDDLPFSSICHSSYLMNGIRCRGKFPLRLG